MPETLKVLAPAKINLVLRVLFRRKDEYHELYTIFQKVTLFDEIEIRQERGFSLEVVGEVSLPRDERNLALRAAKLYFERAGEGGGVSLLLKKRIPVGAGLGGGSSDAAAVLLGLNTLFGAFSPEDLRRLGRSLGADVPFFLCPWSTALGRGIGDELSPWPTHPAWYVLLLPNLEISTPWAYQKLRLTTVKEPPNYEPDQPLWRQGLVNDFEEVIFAEYPELKALKEELLAEGAEAALLSGSGAALFGVFVSRKEAEIAASGMRKKGLKVEVVTNYQP